MKSMIAMTVLIFVFGCSHKPKDQSGCNKLRTCLELASSLTGKNYLYDDMKLEEAIGTIGKTAWNAENADLLIGELLGSAGYYRLDMGNNIYKLINARDIRYVANVKSFSANKETNDTLPAANSADPVELIYKSVNGFNRASDIARNLRPFMSRYGRVIDERSSGLIIVRDTAAAINHLLPLIRKMDAPVTAAEMKEREKDDKMEVLREKTREEMASRFMDMVEKFKKKTDETKSQPVPATSP